MAREIEVVIEIDAGGDVRLEVNGASGPGCKKLTAPYEEMFSGVRTEKLKDEYQVVKEGTRNRVDS